MTALPALPALLLILAGRATAAPDAAADTATATEPGAPHGPGEEVYGARERGGPCFRCHAMATLGFRDEKTGRPVRLAITPAAWHASNHRRLACTKCHDTGFRSWPHPARLAGEKLHCLKCHRDDPHLRARRFPEIGAEVKASAHVRALGAAFDCFACHDPHAFRIGDQGAPPSERAAAVNAVCLGCHAVPLRFATLTDKPPPDLAVAHAWLPNAASHFTTVRCLDCHASTAAPALGHRLLPAREARRGCAECHTRDSALLATLYRHRTRERRAAYGFVNAALLNDAYVVGATRNLALDRLSLGVFGAALLGLAAHAWGRRRGGKP